MSDPTPSHETQVRGMLFFSAAKRLLAQRAIWDADGLLDAHRLAGLLLRANLGTLPPVPRARKEPPLRYILRMETIDDVANDWDLTQGKVADRLGISAGYWSQLRCGRQPVSHRIRKKIMRCSLFQGVAPSELFQVWVRKEGDPWQGS